MMIGGSWNWFGTVSSGSFGLSVAEYWDSATKELV